MRRGIVVGVAGVAVAVAACAGCSSNKSNTGASSSAPSAAGPQVVVDGQNQNVTGQVTCNSANGTTTIGIGDATAGVGAVVSNDNPPVVHSVGLGNVNGVRSVSPTPLLTKPATLGPRSAGSRMRSRAPRPVSI